MEEYKSLVQETKKSLFRIEAFDKSKSISQEFLVRKQRTFDIIDSKKLESIPILQIELNTLYQKRQNLKSKSQYFVSRNSQNQIEASFSFSSNSQFLGDSDQNQNVQSKGEKKIKEKSRYVYEINKDLIKTKNQKKIVQEPCIQKVNPKVNYKTIAQVLTGEYIASLLLFFLALIISFYLKG